MRLKYLLVFNAVVCFVYGITFVLSPAVVLSLHGITQDPSAKLTGQFYGVELIAIGLLTWLARNAGDSEARRAIILALLISTVIGVVIAVLGTVSGVMNAFGWSGAAIYAVLALGYGYFQFAKSGDS
jgi:NAD/NADP transhydrogenase beta subunit